MVAISKRDKVNACQNLHVAVKTGKVIKPRCCSVCKRPTKLHKLQGHHADYIKQLDVIWLCVPCHWREHGRIRCQQGRVITQIWVDGKNYKLPTLKDSPVVNCGLCVEEIEDAHQYYDNPIEWSALFRRLTYREREIIKLRYGIDGGYTHTLEEVARIFKITRSRIGQVEAKAIRKLRQMPEIAELVA